MSPTKICLIADEAWDRAEFGDSLGDDVTLDVVSNPGSLGSIGADVDWVIYDLLIDWATSDEVLGSLSESSTRVPLRVLSMGGPNHENILTVLREISGIEPTASRNDAEARLEGLINALPDAVTVTDLNGVITFVSDRTLELHGFMHASSMIGKPAIGIIAKEDHGKALKNLEATLKEGRLENVRYTLLRKDGTRFPGELNVSVINDDKGKPASFIATTRDITNQVSAEHDLRRASRYWTATFDAINDGICIIDRTGKIIECNARMAEVIGSPLEDVVGGTCWELMHGTNSPVDDCPVMRMLESGSREVLDLMVGDRVFEIIADPLMDENGNVTSAVHILKDITYRREIESELEESEQRFRSLFENSMIGLYRTTPDGRIIDVNPAIPRMLGYESLEELMERDLEGEGYEPNYPRSDFKGMIERDGFVIGLESAWTKADGSPLYVRESAIAVKDSDGSIQFYEGTVEDITERVTAETDLMESEERYRNLVETSPVGVYTTGLDGTIRYVNNALADMMGFGSAEEMMNTDVTLHYSDAGDRERLIELIERDGIVRNFETLAVTSSGDPKNILLSSVKDGDELSGIIVDISEMKEIKETLRETEDRYRTFVQNFPGIAFQGDADWTPLFFHGNVEEITGYSEQEFLKGKPRWDEIIHPDDIESVLESKKDVMTTEKFLTREYRIIRKDGSVRWVRESLRKLVHDGEERFEGILLDITRLMESSMALEKSQELLKDTQRMAKVGGWEYDIDTGASSWTDETYRIHGIPIGEVESLGERSLECYIPEDREILKLAIEGSVQLGEPYDLELRFVSFDGVDKWVRTTCSPVTANGKVVKLSGILMDITERKEAEIAVDVERFKLREYFENLPLMAYNISFDGEILDCNRMVETVLGYEREEIIGKNLIETIYTPESRERANEILKTWKKTGSIRNEELTIRTKDGEEIDILLNVDTIFDNEENPLYSLSTQLDITERKIAQERALAEGEKAQRYLDIAGVIFVAIDSEGKVSLINKKGTEILGRSEEEIVGTDWFENYLPEGIRENVRNVFDKLISGDIEPTEYFENPIIGPNGEEWMIQWHNTVIRDDSGSIIGTLSSGEDVTDLKRWEDTVAREKAYFENLFQNAPEAVIIAENDGTIRTFNTEFKELFGYELEEIKGKKVDDVLVPEDLIEDALILTSSAMKGKRGSIETIRKKANGDTIAVSVVSAPIVLGSDQVGVYGIYRDISDRVKAQQELIDREEMLSAIIAHTDELFFIHDTEHNLTYVSPACKEIFGYDQEEMLVEWLKLVTDNPLNEVGLVLTQTAIDTGVRQEKYNLEVRRKDGELRIVEIDESPMVGDNGEVVAVTGALRDVTEIMRAEEALRESEERYRSIFQTAPNLITSVDEDGKIVDCNDRIRAVLGYTSDEIIGGPMSRIIHPDDLEKAEASLAEILIEGSTFGREYRMVKKDGSFIYVVINSARVADPDGVGARTICLIDDITERKEAEEALRRSEASLKESQRIANIGDWEIDLPSGKVTWSDELYEILAIDKGEDIELNRVLMELVHPEDRDYAEAMITNAMESGELEPFEFRVVRHDGEEIILWTKGRVEKDENGTPIRFFGINQDVTTRIRAEQALKENEERYHRVVDNINDALMIDDIDGNVVFANEAFMEIFGLSVEDGRTLRLEDYIAPDYRETLRDYHERRITGMPAPDRFEYQGLHKEGHRLWLDVNVTAIERDGEIIGTQSIMRDITSKKQAEGALKASEERYRTLFDKSPVGVAMVDIDGNVIAMNDAVLEIMEESMDIVVGKSFLEIGFLPEDQLEPMMEIFRDLLVGNEVLPFELPIDVGEKQKILEIHPGLVKRDDIIEAIQVIARDITNRKEAEDRIRQSLHEKDILLKEIHHRVKNNLQIISSLLNLQSKRIENVEVLEMNRDSRNRIRSMALIHEKLYKSVDLSEVDFHDYLKDLVSGLFQTYSTGAHRVKLKMDVEKVAFGLDTAIPCGLVVNELLSNSLKHAFPGGREGDIIVELRRLEGNRFEMIVGDTGVGLPVDIEELQKKSLGFQLVNSLVRQISGELDIERDSGTKFIIRFEETH